MISKRKKAIVLAYQGTTDSKQFWDEVQSVLITFKVPSDIGNGKVQGYFKKAHDKLYDCVVESMQAQISMYPNYEFWITGHSLGGAIASIASARLLYDGKIRNDKIALYTFGMPRVGDRQYALDHNRLVNNSWRVIHRNDPVPHYPVSTGFSNGPFHHRTEVFYEILQLRQKR
ncbi:lipase ZK262.3-like [Mytilus edulis]|uniref:lipase ZK262.3-like n=1 Tax=Mytilus edulis TaxID=6550 RepID=UPI0039EE4BEE